MKIKRGLLIAFLTAITSCSMALTAFASESAGECHVTIVITDESGTYSGEEILVVMEDMSSSHVEEIVLTAENISGSNHIVKTTIPASATYSISLSGLEDGYTVINTLDRTEREQEFVAPIGIKDFYWSIIQTDVIPESNLGENENMTEVFNGENNASTPKSGNAEPLVSDEISSNNGIPLFLIGVYLITIVI